MDVGSQNLEWVWSRGPGITERERMVLAYMAHRSLDYRLGRDPAVCARYYGGWRSVAQAMAWPDDDAGRQAVARAWRGLQAAGLIKDDGNVGRNRRWLLTL